MDLQAIVTAGTSLKTAADLAKAFVDVKAAVDVQGKVFELQRVILAAQQDTFKAQEAQSTLLEEKCRLEKRVADLEKWQRNEEDYELVEIAGGVFAHTLKVQSDTSGPKHYLCTRCFSDRKKSILVRTFVDVGRKGFQHCPQCKTDFPIFGPGVHSLPTMA